MQKLLILLVAACACVSAAAVTVECSPGQLQSLVASPATETSLTVTGQLDASDLIFISEHMPALATLDIAGATIVEYQGFQLNGHRHYAGNEIPAAVFAGSAISTLVLPDTPLTLGDAAFAGSGLQAVVLPRQLSLGCGVFAGCKQLKTAEIAVSKLSEATFSDCIGLESVTISAACDIGAGAFANCTGLSAVSGSANVKEIGPKAFAGCTGLKTFEFGSGLEAIGDEAFAQSGIEKADLSHCTALRTVGEWTFARCAALTDAALPGQLAGYSSGLFFDCTALTQLTAIPGATAIGDYAFKGSRSLPAGGLLAEGIEELGAYSLAANNSTSVELPSSLSYIGDNAMEGMTQLQEIYGQKLQAVPGLGSEVWTGIDQAAVSLFVDASRTEDFDAADQWCEFHILAYDSSTPEITLTPAPVKGRFAGKELQLDFGSCQASLVELYNVSGTLLVQARPAQSGTLSIDTSDFADNIYLVAVTLTDGTRTALKLAR